MNKIIINQEEWLFKVGGHNTLIRSPQGKSRLVTNREFGGDEVDFAGSGKYFVSAALIKQFIEKSYG